MKANENLKKCFYVVTSEEPAKGKRTHASNQGFPLPLTAKEFPYFDSMFIIDVT